MLENITTREQPIDLSDVDMRNLEFHLLLTANHYSNRYSFHLRFPVKIKKLTNINSKIDHDLIKVNHFFAHWVKEINVTIFGDDMQILQTIHPMKFANTLTLS